MLLENDSEAGGRLRARRKSCRITMSTIVWFSKFYLNVECFICQDSSAFNSFYRFHEELSSCL